MEKTIQQFCILAFGILTAYFESTLLYIIAYYVAFSFNIIAGFRADEVKLKMLRIWPPGIILDKFDKSKFKDSLLEFFLILFTTHILRAIAEMNGFSGKAAMLVQILLGIATHSYLRKSLRNLSVAYPKIVWLKTIYILLAFKFKEIMPKSVSDAVDQAEKEVTDDNK